MADPLAPQDIARRTFDVARRGYEQQEVRGFLHEVSALLERLTRAETELRERAERAEARLGMVEHPDEAMLLEVLGEETTRVLTSARAAAAEIRSKAEASAERIIAEATSEAAEIRGNAAGEVASLVAESKAQSEATLEAARNELAQRSAEAEAAAARIREEAQAQAQTLREEGHADLARARQEAEAALEAARQQGREMLAEAQTVRERVLRDLAVRRKRARQQVEKLNAGRERLLQAYSVVRRTIDEATNELNVSLTDARIAANAAARRVEEEPDTTLEQLDAEVAAAGLADLPITEVDHGNHEDHEDHDDEGSGPLSGEVPAVEVTSRDPSVEDAMALDAAPPEPAPPVQLDERRGRKGRRRKGFEGLPAGELIVVEPPGPDEGVRILAAPASDPADGTTAGDDNSSKDVEPASGRSGADLGEDDLAATGDGPADAAPEAGGAEGGTPDEPSDAEIASHPEAEHSSAHDVFARLRAESEAAGTTEPTTEPTVEVIAGATEATAEPTAGTTEPTVEVTAGTSEAIAEPAAEPTAGPAEAASALDDGGPAATAATAEAADTAVDEPGEPDSVEPSAEAAAFSARAEAVEPVEKELGRRLKRALADEQNEVLDLLRRAKPKGVDDLLPAADDHAAHWAEAVAATLREAATAGAAAHGGTATSTADLADDLARGLTAPLRERIDRSFVASDGNLDDIADRVRALYREWKGQRLTETAQHFVAAAYARGVFDAIDADTRVQWVVDPAAGACPDCADNVLGGAIIKGEEFPTGNPCAPAHPGCHCLVLPAPS